MLLLQQKIFWEAVELVNTYTSDYGYIVEIHVFCLDMIYKHWI